MRLEYSFDERDGHLMLEDIMMNDGDMVRLFQRVDPWVLTIRFSHDGKPSPYTLDRVSDGVWCRDDNETGERTPVEFKGCANV